MIKSGHRCMGEGRITLTRKTVVVTKSRKKNTRGQEFGSVSPFGAMVKEI